MNFKEALESVSQENQDYVAHRQKQGWTFDLATAVIKVKGKKITQSDWTASKIFNVADKVFLLQPSLESLLAEIEKEEAKYLAEKIFNQPEAKPIEAKIVYRNCRVSLTDVEVQERGQSLIKTMDDKDAELADFVAYKNVHKSNIKKFDGSIQQLRHAIAQKSEYQMIECLEVFDYANSRVRIERNDIGEILEERAMSNDERQANLFEENEDE